MDVSLFIFLKNNKTFIDVSAALKIVPYVSNV